MQILLLFLVEQRYTAQIKGKNWFCLLEKQNGLEATNRYFKCSFEVIFTPEMVKSVEILLDNTAIITLVH
jgi:hypothetical protein